MDAFNYREANLFAEEVPVDSIAERFGTPCYVYSVDTFKRHFTAFADPLAASGVPHQICYAVKANSNIAILKLLADLGSGFDVVSMGELQRVLAAGGEAGKTIFSGVGKSVEEIRFALEVGIECLNVESVAELDRIANIAKSMGVQAPIAIRVNPDVDANTHPYIATGLKENKFGVEMGQAEALCQQAHANDHLKLLGVGCHIGSQLLSVEPFVEAVGRVLGLYQRLQSVGITLTQLDFGGGLGVPYQGEEPPSPKSYIEAIVAKLAEFSLNPAPKLMFEPGRAIAANAGILVTRVEYLKPTQEKDFVVVDAAMNDLLRPSLYSAWQEIVPVDKALAGETITGDIVGPVCETGDFLGKEREVLVAEGSLLAVRTAGAYGFTMSSNYNTRNRAAEVLVDGSDVMLIRQRECFDDQIRLETVTPERHRL